MPSRRAALGDSATARLLGRAQRATQLRLLQREHQHGHQHEGHEDDAQLQHRHADAGDLQRILRQHLAGKALVLGAEQALHEAVQGQAQADGGDHRDEVRRVAGAQRLEYQPVDQQPDEARERERECDGRPQRRVQLVDGR
jgi:hypothetical protein